MNYMTSSKPLWDTPKFTIHLDRLSSAKFKIASPNLHKRFKTSRKRIERKKLPKNAYLFTADAKSMYTFIDTNHALFIFWKWFSEYKQALLIGFPENLILQALELMMKHNLFEFGDTVWLQLI